MDETGPEATAPTSPSPDPMVPSLLFVDPGAAGPSTDAEVPSAVGPQEGSDAASDPASRGPVSRRAGLAVVLLAVLLAGCAGAAIGVVVGSRSTRVIGAGTLTYPPPGSSTLPHGAASLNAIAKSLTPSVVDIDTSVEEGLRVGEAAGSGMILTASGEVLTNNHVVEHAASISVVIYGRSRPVAAKVVGVDTVHDVALLQLTGVSSLPHVVLGDSADLKVGDGVVAIGNALGLGGPPAVTGGAVGALDQSINATNEVTPSSESLSGLIETNARIQPGDSGGPLVDAAGHVVGMDTAAASTDAGALIGFAIPINQAIAIAKNIERGDATNGIIVGLSAYLGVEVPASTSGHAGARATGQFVEAVIPGGPAASAGVVAGDTITAIDGRALSDKSSSLTAILDELRPGVSARLRVVNPKGAASMLPVVLGGIPS